MTEALKPSEVLERAAALIEPEGAWTQGHGARDAGGGELVGPRSELAACWCLYGAMLRAGAGDEDAAAEEFVRRALSLADFVDVFDWNDAPDRTQPEVVAALRKAAELARSEGQ